MTTPCQNLSTSTTRRLATLAAASLASLTLLRAVAFAQDYQHVFNEYKLANVDHVAVQTFVLRRGGTYTFATSNLTSTTGGACAPDAVMHAFYLEGGVVEYVGSNDDCSPGTAAPCLVLTPPLVSGDSHTVARIIVHAYDMD